MISVFSLHVMTLIREKGLQYIILLLNTLHDNDILVVFYVKFNDHDIAKCDADVTEFNSFLCNDTICQRQIVSLQRNEYRYDTRSMYSVKI